MAVSEKIMFEIYRETGYSGEFRVVYFTELSERNKESEINKAMAGEHYLDGFIPERRKDEAKEAISSLLYKLNEGEPLTSIDARGILEPYLKE
jgi:hypothetical protein